MPDEFDFQPSDDGLDFQPEFEPNVGTLSPVSDERMFIEGVKDSIRRGREFLSPILGDTERQAALRLGGEPNRGLLQAKPAFEIPRVSVPPASPDANLLERGLTGLGQLTAAQINTVGGLAQGIANPLAAMTLAAGSSRIPAAIFGTTAAIEAPSSVASAVDVIRNPEASFQQKAEAGLGALANAGIAVGGLTHAIRGTPEAPVQPVVEETPPPPPPKPDRVRIFDFIPEQKVVTEAPEAPVVIEPAVTSPAEAPPSVPTPPEAAAKVSEIPEGQLGIKHAVVDERIKQLGLVDREKPVPESERLWWESAVDTATKDPQAGTRLIESLVENPRELSARDTALALHELATRDQEVHAASEAVNAATSDLDRQDASLRLDRALNAYDEAARATATAGTESGRALRARQMMLNQDFTLARMTTRARAANGGKPLPPERQAEVAATHQKIQENIRQQDALANLKADQDAKALFDDLLTQIRKGAEEAKKGGSFVGFLQQQREEARLRIRQRLTSGQVSANPVTTLAAHIADEAIIGATYIAEGVTNFAKWSAEIVKDIGAKSDDYLKELFKRSQDYHDSTEGLFGATSKVKPTKEILGEASKEDGITRKLVYDLARNHVKAGVEGFDNVFEAVLADVREAFPNATMREVKDAFSDYGKVKLPSKDADKVALREYRRLAQLGSAIEDAQNKLPPKRTGLQRDKTTQAVRERMKELREEMRKNGIQVTSPEAQLASAQQAVKTRLSNQIEDLGKEIDDLEKQINEGVEAKKKTKTNIPYDEESNRLKARRDELASHRDELKTMISEMEGKKAMTDAERNAAAIRAAERSLAEYNRRIQERDFEVKRTPFEASEELKKIRAERDAARAQYEALKAENTDPQAEELKLYKAAVRKRIAELEERISKGDYARKSKRDIELDAEGLKLRAEAEDLKRKFNEEVIKIEMANQSAPKKFFRRFHEASNLARALTTSFDLSAVLRQGGFITFAHPIRSAKIIPDMIRAMFSEKERLRVMEEIRSRPNAPLYQRAKLFLSEEGTSLNKMEEAYMSRWAQKIPGIKASERAYTTFLNRLRADSFDAMADAFSTKGKLTKDEANAIANYINVATGRGDAGGAAKAAVALNGILFSPRYLLSRIQLITGQPFYRGTARTRIAIAKEYARFLVGASVVYALGQAAGGTVESDPRSSDFLKIRLGDTRIDPLGGLIQLMVLGSRLFSGKTKTLSGNVQPIRGPGVRYGGTTGEDVLFRFARSKLAPIPGSLVNLSVGKNVVGQPTDVKTEVLNQIPISIQDIQQQFKNEEFPKAIADSILALLGFGVQNYSPQKPVQREQ